MKWLLDRILGWQVVRRETGVLWTPAREPGRGEPGFIEVGEDEAKAEIVVGHRRASILSPEASRILGKMGFYPTTVEIWTRRSGRQEIRKKIGRRWRRIDWMRREAG